MAGNISICQKTEGSSRFSPQAIYCLQNHECTVLNVFFTKGIFTQKWKRNVKVFPQLAGGSAEGNARIPNRGIILLMVLVYREVLCVCTVYTHRKENAERE